MIESLDISNLGVIANAHVDFGPGLVVVTGETGAGKTMVLSSLQLLLGARADAALVRSGTERLSVDGIFSITPDIGSRVEDAGGLVEGDELIVGRSVRAAGRSRAHLGSRPVPASVLADIVGSMVTIHGQSDQIRLTGEAAQRRALDQFGGSAHAAVVEEYRAAFRGAVDIKHRLDSLRGDATERAEEIEDLRAAIDQIEALDPQPGEEENLVREAARLTNVEDLRGLMGASLGFLKGDDRGDYAGAVEAARSAYAQLDEASRFDEAVADFVARARNQALELDALADDVSSYLSRLDADPQRLAQIHTRRAALKDALRGRAADIEGLLAWVQEARVRLAELSAPASDPALVEEELRAAQEHVLACGSRLTAARATLAAELASGVNEELHALSMPDATLHIDLEATKPTSHGCESVVFRLQPHPHAPARPLGQGASGGELSRVMLALELMLGRTEASSTFIFDEIDAGIGGQTATEVGARLKRLAASRQVIVVTHLAQVAAFGDQHLVIEKSDGTTQVREVRGEAREAELTRMMGGDPHSAAARRHASQVLASAVSQSQG
ncbi:MAG: DNA repair protein RecN [Actinomyces sp.]|nr:DNA repair protein RecN [Actinomyces sp.]